jgi:hypothetical protein
MTKMSEYEDSLDIQSHRTDQLEKDYKAVKGKHVQFDRDIRTVKHDTTTVKNRVDALDKSMADQFKKFQDQLRNISAGAPAATAMGPNIPEATDVSITIDGVREYKHEDLAMRCQEHVFRAMGLNFGQLHMEQCFRLGRERKESGNRERGDVSDVIPGRPRTIFVKFHAQDVMDAVMRRRYTLRGRHVFINQYFDWEVEKDRRRQYCILQKARSIKKYRNKIEHVENKVVLEGVEYGVDDFEKLPTELQPKNICTETIGDITYFYKEDSPLSNHHKCSFKVDDFNYSCSEQLYFCKKAIACKDYDAVEELRSTSDAKQHKYIGGRVKGDEDWENAKFEAMMSANRDKFSQNPHLLSFLLDTGTNLLCEDNPNDNYWGLGMTRKNPKSRDRLSITGNNMGKVLMKLRSEFRAMDT